MNNAALTFPEPLVRLVGKLPTLPPSLIFTWVLDLVLHEVIRSGALQVLHGKHIAIRVADTGLCLYFTLLPEGFSCVTSSGIPDLSISATMHDFYLLATRKEDPDTLFFKRRLLVEGDTELGLVVKNALDGMELDAAAMLAPGNLLALFKSGLLRVFK